MISADPQAEGGAKGFLIDLEYAAFLQDRRSTSTLREMTGTVYFMALERQDSDYSGKHKAYHDLESFYWSLVYTTVRYTVTNDGARSCNGIFTHRNSKSGFLADGRRQLVVLDNPRLTACIRSFGRVASKSHHARKYMTHASAIKTLDDELVKSGWPENDPALPLESLETSSNEDLGGSRRLTALMRASKEMQRLKMMRQAVLKRKAEDEDGNEQTGEVALGEPSASKRSRQQ
ncbi:hypothetical protein OE88DRAFT_1656261 [Heliocybe sulcata]|uniref:Fungal-type protein kinase domain-containing protein n=1 Tax=Heliocybe sulcata TaxID=5364 RepID=A0A5C3NGQ6_9AGAM|nr:hypothetical protein OE88DRAFT_1656261 [Heliocybe sulcata]